MEPFTRTIQIGPRAYPLTGDDTYLRDLADPFEPDLVALATVLLQPTQVVCDIGANIGCTALLFSQFARTVHAYEPVPSTFQFLATNVAAIPTITAYNYGLGRDAAQIPLHYAADNRAGGFLAPTLAPPDGHRTETAQIYPLDQCAFGQAVPRVDVLKLDVEGSELAVLAGARATLAVCQPLVILEMNHWCLNAFHRITIPDFLDQLCATFPLLLALQGSTWLNVHDPGERYVIMYRHILQFHYMTLVGAFTAAQVQPVLDTYRHGAA
jgi:FkbM family methyltransferase